MDLSLRWTLGAFAIFAGSSCTESRAASPVQNLEVKAKPEAPMCNLSARDPAVQYATLLIEEGRRTFRFDTFGDEAFWGDTLQLHRAIEGEARGGVGAGLSPRAALALGLKVDADALPAAVQAQLNAGQLDLRDPKTTLSLLELNAVVGVTGFYNPDKSLRSVGIQCALCHSTVDDSLAPGIGKRLDGWANRDLDMGAIMALSPDLSSLATSLQVSQTTVRTVLTTWGPGKFDARLMLDGKAFRPDASSPATLIPPVFGLGGVNLETSTGWGSVTHWNAFAANVAMRGKGTFFDPRLSDEGKFPVAARAGMGNVRHNPDLVTPRLAALHFYQLALKAPTPASSDPTTVARGKTLFETRAACATCHVPPLFSEPGLNMHTAAEIGIDDFQARRSPDERYRTTPLAGLFTHQKGGFYHDGRFATLQDVVTHYDTHFQLELTAQEQTDLVEYLKSL